MLQARIFSGLSYVSNLINILSTYECRTNTVDELDEPTTTDYINTEAYETLADCWAWHISWLDYFSYFTQQLRTLDMYHPRFVMMTLVTCIPTIVNYCIDNELSCI